MATWLSDQDCQKSGATAQMESKTLAPLRGQNDPEETEVSCSAPSCSPSWSPVRRLMPDHHETWYCLEIQVTLPKEGGATSPSPHAWQAPVVEHMLCDGKSGLTEVIVMGTGCPVLFYCRQSLGGGLSLGEVQDAMFTLSGASVGLAGRLNLPPIHWTCGKADGRVHSTSHQSCLGCSTGEKVLLPLQHPRSLHLWLPMAGRNRGGLTFKPEGGDGTKEGSSSPQEKATTLKVPQGGTPQV